MNLKNIKIYNSPVRHIKVENKKKFHCWYKGERECTAERFLLNPYNGCTNDCIYCYSNAFRSGYFNLYRKEKIVTVFENYDKAASYLLDKLNIACCGYLSPVADPFQPINEKYNLSELVIKEFIKRNLPVDIVTKYNVSDEVIAMCSENSDCIIQFSLNTSIEYKRKSLMKQGLPAAKIFRLLEKISKNNIYTVLRIDPIIPYYTDDLREIKYLIDEAKNAGVKHIIASCLDIPLMTKNIFLKQLKNINSSLPIKFLKLYNEKMKSRLHSDIKYRKELFEKVKSLCEDKKMSFALCAEFEKKGEKYIGLNKIYSNSKNCEGKNIPIYIRQPGEKYFKPLKNCYGNCLSCNDNVCNIYELNDKTIKDKNWEYRHFKKWSKEILNYRLNLK